MLYVPLDANPVDEPMERNTSPPAAGLDVASLDGSSCRAVDWRDEELTRRLLEMQLLAEELRVAEDGPAPQ